MLKLENLTKRYNTGDLALQGIDLSIPNGQVLIIGPSELENLPNKMY